VAIDISPVIVQNWINDSTKNLGLLIKSDDESAAGYLWCFFADNPAVNLRPKLRIFYAP
jgi:hypothetical protein